MDNKKMAVANVHYKKPTESKEGKGLLRYLTYRDGRYGPIIQDVGEDRWHDHGMGATVGEIAKRCDDYKSDHVLAFTLVFNPNVDLMAMVPMEHREAFVENLTETALERFFEARGAEEGIEYSYVLHHRESEDKEAPGLHDPHTHVILPGTLFDEDEGQRTALYFSQRKKVDHIEMLHRATEQTTRDLMDRYAEPGWEQRYDILDADRERQRQVIQGDPHCGLVDHEGRTWEMWFGSRRGDTETGAVGFYRYFPKDEKSKKTEFTPDELELQFRPIASGLTADRADRVARLIGDYALQHPDTDMMILFQHMEYIGSLSPAEQDQFMNDYFTLPDQDKLKPKVDDVPLTSPALQPPIDPEPPAPEPDGWSGFSMDF